MAAELGQQEIEAPQLCPKCRRLAAGHQAESEPRPSAEAKDSEPKRAEHAAEPIAAPEAVSTQEPEPEPEPESAPEPEPESEPVSATETLPAFDEALLDEIGIKIKLIGQVKWFSRKKGFGFVTKADGEELFFHRSDVQGQDVRLLRDGIQVEFQIRRTDKGLEAFDVSILPAS
jgi:CspA family cold shock protein